MIWCSIGPRITMGLSPGEMYPMEMVLMPWVRLGMIWLPGPTDGLLARAHHQRNVGAVHVGVDEAHALAELARARRPG